MALPKRSKPKKRRASGNCVKCGMWRKALHQDHIVPRWAGGLDDDSNYQYLCANCHEDKTLEEKQSLEYREYCRVQMKQRMLSPEARANISAAVKRSNRFRKWTEESRHKCGWLRGKKRKPFTAEHRAHISASRRGIKFSPEHIERLKTSHQGKPWSQARRRAYYRQVLQ